MAKSSKSAAAVCILDSGVIINWLSRETDPITSENLWSAPHKIIKLIEAGVIKGATTVLNLLEIRFVLRRKKEFTADKIRMDIDKILSCIEIIIPDEIALLKANSLQDGFPFSPFDAILVSCSSMTANAILVSRDKALLQLANSTP